MNSRAPEEVPSASAPDLESGLSPDGSLSLTRSFNYSSDELFRTWTDPACLRDYWDPAGARVASAVVDLRPGGAYRIVLEGGYVGQGFTIFGEFLEVDRPSRLVYTWNFTSGNVAEEDVSVVSVTFTEANGPTLLRLEYSGASDPLKRRRQHEGWVNLLNGLVEYLSTRPLASIA